MNWSPPSPSLAAPVLIAGAGPVGLALALGLAEQGVRSIVCEEKAALSEHSPAPGILTRTLEILRAWGVLDRFLAEGEHRVLVQAWAVDGTSPAVTFDFSTIAGHTATPGILILPQNRTEALLYDAVRERGLTEVYFQHKVTAFDEDEVGVAVRIDNAGTEIRARCQYLAGCDGAHSAVRQGLGWHLEGKTYPTVILLADVRLDDTRDSLPWPRFVPRARGALAAIRIAPRLWRIIATLHPGESEEEAVSAGSIRQKVASLFGDGPHEDVWSSVFHIHCRKSPHFVSGRVLLAGDAAHINSPAGGQGMNSGIQDAHNLAWKLARVLRGADPWRLLNSYEEERRGVVTHSIERFTDLLTRVVLLGRPSLRAVLAGIVPRLVRFRPIMRRVALRIGMLNIRYPRSSILPHSQGLAGCRAPDGELVTFEGKPLRLHDLVAREPALIRFAEACPNGEGLGEPPWAGACGVPHFTILPRAAAPHEGAFSDAGGGLWQAWRATPGLVALIRPDAIVAWTCPRPTPEQVREAVAYSLGEREAAYSRPRSRVLA